MSKLLAPKLFLFNKTSGNLHPYYNPHVEWPNGRIVTISCFLRHEEPVEGCTCGVVHDLDLDLLHEVHASADPHSHELFPVVGVTQVLGTTVLDRAEKRLRSKKAFLWGVVPPKVMSRHDLWMMMSTSMHGTYPCIYNMLGEAVIEVERTFGTYGLDIYKPGG